MYFSYPPHKRIVTDKFLDPLHPKISMHILHTVLYTFPLVLTRRICLKIKSFFTELVIISSTLMASMFQ